MHIGGAAAVIRLQAKQVGLVTVGRPVAFRQRTGYLVGLLVVLMPAPVSRNRGWPKFASHLWMATVDGGLAAISYAPCRVSALVAGGIAAGLLVTTNYPFDEQITITLQLAHPAHFPVKLRIPAWCSAARLAINNRPIDLECAYGEYVTLADTWQDGDRLQLTLPMPVHVERRGQGALGIQRGPLVYVLAVEERWQKLRGNDPYADWEVYPASPWNYGLLMDKLKPERSLRVETHPVARQPFVAKDAPVRLIGKGRRIPDWTLAMNSADTPPLSPVASEEPLEDITLVPYGSARLRIAEFPVLSDTPRLED